MIHNYALAQATQQRRFDLEARARNHRIVFDAVSARDYVSMRTRIVRIVKHLWAPRPYVEPLALPAISKVGKPAIMPMAVA